jgi:hypothetical protein
MIVSERDGACCNPACEMKGEFASPVQQVLCACRVTAPQGNFDPHDRPKSHFNAP